MDTVIFLREEQKLEGRVFNVQRVPGQDSKTLTYPLQDLWFPWKLIQSQMAGFDSDFGIFTRTEDPKPGSWKATGSPRRQ